MSESFLQILHTKAQQIDIGRTGLLATTINDFLLHPDISKLLNELIKIGLAQGILQGVFPLEAAAIVREISPYRDLLDGRGEKIQHNQWVQPTRPMLFFSSYSMEKEKTISMYKTDKESKNNQKIIIIYGVEFLNGWTNRNVERIEFCRGVVKTISTLDIQKTPPNILNMKMETPIMPIAGLDSETDEPTKQTPSLITGVPNTIYHNDMMLLS